MGSLPSLETYTRFQQRTGIDALSPSSGVVARLENAPLGDASRIHAVPLILTASEREQLRDATGQRARALQCFFADLAGGHPAFLDRPGGMPSALVDRVLASHGHRRDDLTRCWSARTRDDVCFTYAPDLVRVGGGSWGVLEDNIGCIGGLADSYYCQQAYLEAVELDPGVHGEEPPDLCQGVQAFLGNTAPSDVDLEVGCDGTVDGKIVQESARRAALLQRLGLPAGARGEVPAPATRLVNFGTARRECYADFARGALAMLNAPFVEILGDKRLLPYVEAMVAFYSGEVPALRSLPARAIEGLVDVAGMASGVVKHGRGAQGTAVYFLDDPDERHRAMTAIAEAEPWSFIVQDPAPSTTPAVPAHARLELRPFAFVAGDRTWASRIPSARVPRSDRRRANISQGAHYAAVLTERI